MLDGSNGLLSGWPSWLSIVAVEVLNIATNICIRFLSLIMVWFVHDAKADIQVLVIQLNSIVRMTYQPS